MTLQNMLEPRTRQGSRARFGQIGQRLTGAFRPVDEGEYAGGDTQAMDLLPAEDEVLPRFPMSRQGYHCASVDEYVAELEQELGALSHELAQLRTQTETQDEVRSEIQRIGEQTSAVLIAAHEQREEILRLARVEADRAVADARTQASRLTAESEARLRELMSVGEAIQRERDRLLDEARSVSVSLAALVDGAHAGSPEDATVPAAQAT